MRDGKHELGLMGWVGDNGDPDNYLYVLFDPDNAQVGRARNLSFLKNAELHERLLSAQKVLGRKERTEIYRKAQEQIEELAPWVPLAHSQISVVASSDVEGLILGPTSQIVYSRVDRK